VSGGGGCCGGSCGAGSIGCWLLPIMRRCICAIRTARSASWPPVVVVVPSPCLQCRKLASAISAVFRSSSSVVSRWIRTSRRTSSRMFCIVPCSVNWSFLIRMRCANRALSSTYFLVGSSGPWNVPKTLSSLRADRCRLPRSAAGSVRLARPLTGPPAHSLTTCTPPSSGGCREGGGIRLRAM